MPRADAEPPHRSGPRVGDSSKQAAQVPGRRSREPAIEVRLTGDRLVVRSPPTNGERTSSGGLLIPATATPAPKRLSWADVLLVGPDVRVASNRATGCCSCRRPASRWNSRARSSILLRERDVQAVSPAADDKAERPPASTCSPESSARDELRPYRAHVVLAVRIHQHDALPCPQRESSANHGDHQDGETNTGSR